MSAPSQPVLREVAPTAHGEQTFSEREQDLCVKGPVQRARGEEWRRNMFGETSFDRESRLQLAEELGIIPVSSHPRPPKASHLMDISTGQKPIQEQGSEHQSGASFSRSSSGTNIMAPFNTVLGCNLHSDSENGISAHCSPQDLQQKENHQQRDDQVTQERRNRPRKSTTFAQPVESWADGSVSKREERERERHGEAAVTATARAIQDIIRKKRFVRLQRKEIEEEREAAYDRMIERLREEEEREARAAEEREIRHRVYVINFGRLTPAQQEASDPAKLARPINPVFERLMSDQEQEYASERAFFDGLAWKRRHGQKIAYYANGSFYHYDGYVSEKLEAWE